VKTWLQATQKIDAVQGYLLKKPKCKSRAWEKVEREIIWT